MSLQTQYIIKFTRTLSKNTQTVLQRIKTKTFSIQKWRRLKQYGQKQQQCSPIPEPPKGEQLYIYIS